MTLIIGSRCQDGIVLAADRRRMARYEKGPDTNKLFKLGCGVFLTRVMMLCLMKHGFSLKARLKNYRAKHKN